MLNVLVIGGRSQEEGYSNGSTELEEVLIEAVDSAGYSPMQVRIRFYPWYQPWQEEARRLHLLRLRYKLKKSEFGIVVCAFSRGVGYGVMHLAGYQPWYRKLYGVGGLERFGLTIDTLVDCDGIYHNWYMLYRSVIGGHAIKFPANGVISKVCGFNQNKVRPMGVKPVVSPPTVITSWEELYYEHVEMDDAPEYHEKAKEVVLEAALRFVPRSQKGLSPAAGRPDVPNPSELLNQKMGS